MRQLLSGQRRSLLIAAFATFVAAPVFAQGTVITGTITRQEGGGPLFGANVYITELAISAGTNEQGVYRLTLPAERVRGQNVMLRVRSIGFKPGQKSITLAAGGGTITENFALEIDVNRLSEVVVTGVTGATEKKKLAFTVDQVNVADLPVPGTNALTQLQGKVTGAQIVSPSGRPGQAPSIVLRGPKSLNASGRSQAPLVIVDGVIYDGGLQDLNPMDIENVEVVKGAAAASVYGSRAGNGVIQVTTKSAKNARQGTRFNVRNEAGYNDIAGEFQLAKNHFIMMDPTNKRFCRRATNAATGLVNGQPQCWQTMDFEEEALRINEGGGQFALGPNLFQYDGGIALSLSKPQLRGLFQSGFFPRSYDPIAATTTNGLFNNATFEMTGKFNNTGVFASASQLRQEGAIDYLKGYTRNTFRLNADQQINDKWTTQLNTFYSNNTLFPDGEFFRLTRVPAGVNLQRRDAFGRLFVRSNPLNQGDQNANPLYWNEANQGRTDTDRFLASNTTRFAAASWLDFEANASYDRRRQSGFFQQDRGYRVTTSTGTTGIGNRSESSSLDDNINMSIQGTARKSNFVLDGLDARVNARYAYEQQDSEGIGSSGTTLAIPSLGTLNNVTANQSVSSGFQTVRAVGGVLAGGLDYKGRYIMDGLVRRDGSSLFGENNRWATYYRGSMAWRLSDESWWPLKTSVNDFKLRGSYGTAGGRPSFSAQYETFTIGAGGTVTASTLGNANLRPEYTTEQEYGLDAELFSKIGLNVTYAYSSTDDQIILVPPSVSSGFANQWRNGGTLDNHTWEVSLNIPVLTTNNLTWTSRVGWDQTYSFITDLDIPPFFQTTASSTFRFAEGERIGTIWGRAFVTSCSQLPAQFAADCGAGKSYQKNNQGLIVWTGAGNTTKDGITKNLWQAVNPGCVRNGTATGTTGEANCRLAGGQVNAPWGIPGYSWGMPIVLRDSTGNAIQARLGNTLPKHRINMSHNVSYKKFNLYALVDVSLGNAVFNQERHWSLGDFQVREGDQSGKSVGDAKPLGYYWRTTAPDNSAGVGGLYDILGSNNITTEDAAYGKLREVSLGYQLGRFLGLGDVNVSVVGRNLLTITNFTGWDPEVGVAGTNLNSSALTAVAAFQYPQMRTFTFTVGTRF
ncbi:MAG: SusC/RagA family TonB-linked outer membrane protein [Gemmatimonadetes bacterium]|nr:SusC/RagA family TonB-linked outer membrane protein [Gemmatimonadota bacterium]